MCHLFETISIRGGVAENLPWHQRRLESSYFAMFGKAPVFNLSELIRIPMEAQHGHFRCRVDYDRQIRGISYTPYILREIKSLRLIEDNAIEYRHKFADRIQLDRLFALRGNCADVLIVKNGLITDTSFANIILWDGLRWSTPAEPLLPGTCRARLLAGGIISAAKISLADLHLFREIKLINALRGMDDQNGIPLNSIN